MKLYIVNRYVWADQEGYYYDIIPHYFRKKENAEKWIEEHKDKMKLQLVEEPIETED